MKKALFVLLAITGMLGITHAQTTLSGNHIITGDLNVGTSGAKGNLEVTGETGGSANPGINVTGDGGIVFQGTSGTGQIPASGAGARLMWYSKKAAFRAGEVSNNQWNDGQIGAYSVALGLDTKATSWCSFAACYETTAAGEGAAAFGWYTLAGGDYSIASGFFSYATGTGAAAFGFHTTAYGTFASTFGSYTYGIGEYSMAWGKKTGAIGDYSTSVGEGTNAGAYASFAIGRYNVGGGSPTSWVDSDPLFEIGIGAEDWSEGPPVVVSRNALTVYKNGKVEMNAEVRITKRQGDILMGEFGNPE